MMCPDRLIATGTRYAVYDSPDDQYVIRAKIVKASSEGFVAPKPSHEAVDIKHLPADKLNYGQAVATYGSGVTLNYRKPGKSLYSKHFPADSPVTHFLSSPSDLEDILSSTADISFEGYKSIFDEMALFTKHNMLVDFNPGNILFDDKRKQLGLIDPLPDDPDLTPEEINVVDSLLRILTHSYISHADLQTNDNQRATIIRLQKRIIRNVLHAASNSECGFSMCFSTLSYVLKATSCSDEETQEFMQMARREKEPASKQSLLSMTKAVAAL